MKNILYIILNFTLILFINCGAEDPLSSPEETIPENFIGLYIEHQQNLDFKIKAKRLSNVGYLAFYLKYDTLGLDYSTYSPLITTTDFTAAVDDENGVGIAFSFTSPQSNDFDLMSITFESKSGAENTILQIKDLILLNSTGSEIECENCGRELCYLDQGVLVQVLENTDQPASSWTPTNEYVWSDAFCGYIN